MNRPTQSPSSDENANPYTASDAPLAAVAVELTDAEKAELLETFHRRIFALGVFYAMIGAFTLFAASSVAGLDPEEAGLTRDELAWQATMAALIGVARILLGVLACRNLWWAAAIGLVASLYFFYCEFMAGPQAVWLAWLTIETVQAVRVLSVAWTLRRAGLPLRAHPDEFRPAKRVAEDEDDDDRGWETDPDHPAWKDDPDDDR